MNKSDETIIYQKRPSWLYYHWLYIAGIILFLFSIKSGELEGGLFALLFIIGLAAIFRHRYQFTVTSSRVIMRVGLIAKNTNEIQLRHIRAINVRQGIVERILGIGTVEFSSAAGGGVEVLFKGISDPHGVKERIKSLQG